MSSLFTSDTMMVCGLDSPSSTPYVSRSIVGISSDLDFPAPVEPSRNIWRLGSNRYLEPNSVFSNPYTNPLLFGCPRPSQISEPRTASGPAFTRAPPSTPPSAARSFEEADSCMSMYTDRNRANEARQPGMQ